MKVEDLKTFIRQNGERVPKKHGEWKRIHAYDNHYLILDTWNGHVYHYPNGAKEHDINNMYRCVYCFYDINGCNDNYERIGDDMAGFWYAHIYFKTNKRIEE